MGRNDFLGKKLEKKYLIRRVVCGSIILIGCVLIAGGGYKNKKHIGDKSAIIKNSYNIEINKEELDEMYKELNVVKTDFEWADDVKKGNNPNELILHHSAIEDMTVDEVHQKHIENGWSGIGYHYFIRKDGMIYQGRPEDMIGAHVKENNINTLGVCLEGNFENTELTQQQEKSVLNLLRYLFLKYDIESLKGHRDLGETLCPGEKLKVTDIKNKLDSLVIEGQNKVNNVK